MRCYYVKGSTNHWSYCLVTWTSVHTDRCAERVASRVFRDTGHDLASWFLVGNDCQMVDGGSHRAAPPESSATYCWHMKRRRVSIACCSSTSIVYHTMSLASRQSPSLSRLEHGVPGSARPERRCLVQSYVVLHPGTGSCGPRYTHVSIRYASSPFLEGQGGADADRHRAQEKGGSGCEEKDSVICCCSSVPLKYLF